MVAVKMTRSSLHAVFKHLTCENIREHLIYNDSVRPKEISHLIVVPFDQLSKYVSEDRFDESVYVWELQNMHSFASEKVCSLLKILYELMKKRQRSRKAMLAAILQQTGNVKFCWDKYKTQSAAEREEDVSEILNQKSLLLNSREVEKVAPVAAVTPKTSPVIPRGIPRDKAATKAGVAILHASEPLHFSLLPPNEIDEKIDQVIAKIEHRFEKLERCFDCLEMLIDTKKHAIEQSIRADEDLIQEKKQSIQEYENLIHQKKQSIHEDEKSIREKKRALDQFLQNTEVFLEEAKCKYQCVGGALNRARITTNMTNPSRNSETMHAASKPVRCKTTGSDDGE